MTRPVAIVTGASRGIGAATARLLGGRGYAVCVNYKSSRKEAETLAASLPRAVAVQADVANEADVIRLFETVDKELGSVGALVNNAGISGGRMAFEEMTSAQIEQIFATNVFGAMLCCREAIKRMKAAKKGGAIVNVSSMAATGGGRQLTVYAASKAALGTLTIGLARETAAHGIRVNAVSPGIIAAGENLALSEEILSALPMGRPGAPEEVAEVIAWLLSPAASYVSGGVIPVSGAR